MTDRNPQDTIHSDTLSSKQLEQYTAWWYIYISKEKFLAIRKKPFFPGEIECAWITPTASPVVRHADLSHCSSPSGGTGLLLELTDDKGKGCKVVLLKPTNAVDVFTGYAINELNKSTRISAPVREEQLINTDVLYPSAMILRKLLTWNQLYLYLVSGTPPRPDTIDEEVMAIENRGRLGAFDEMRKFITRAITQPRDEHDSSDSEE